MALEVLYFKMTCINENIFSITRKGFRKNKTNVKIFLNSTDLQSQKCSRTPPVLLSIAFSFRVKETVCLEYAPRGCSQVLDPSGERKALQPAERQLWMKPVSKVP